MIDFAGDMVVCLGYCERGLDEGTGWSATTRRSASPATASSDGTARSTCPPAIAPLFAAGDGFRAFDTPVGPDGPAHRPRQDLPGGGARPGRRRRRDPRVPLGVADLADQPRAADGAGPPGAAVRPLRPGARRREPGRPGCRRTRAGATARCTSWAGRRSSGRVGRSSRAPGRRAGSRWRRSTSRSWSGRPGRCCTTSPSVVPRPTVDRADRPADLLDEAARRCRAHARAGRGAGARRARRDGVGAGAGRRHGLLPARRRRGDRPAGARRRRSRARRSGSGSCGRSRCWRRRSREPFDVVHAQDCLTANAVGRARGYGACGGPCTTSTSSRRPSSPPATSGRSWSRRRWCACRRRWRARSGRAGAGRPR